MGTGLDKTMVGWGDRLVATERASSTVPRQDAPVPYGRVPTAWAPRKRLPAIPAAAALSA